VEIRSKWGKGSIIVEPGNADRDFNGFTLAVTASSAGFSGASDRVWINRESAASFIDDLRALESTRQGEANLVSTRGPYTEFKLRIFSTDKLGHMGVTVLLVLVYSPSLTPLIPMSPYRVELDFAFYPTDLPQILKDFKRLLESGS
jgi:hypothetical protein